MPLSSTSTYAEIQAEYLDTAGYDATGDVALARRFITACRYLILLSPQRSEHGDERIEFDRDRIKDQEAAAKAFVKANATVSEGGSGYIHADLAEFRS